MNTWLLTLLLAMNIPPASESTPNKQPQLAAANGEVALVFGSGHSVMFSRSKDGGATFSSPALVAEVPGLMLGRHRGPRVAISGRAILVSAIGSEGNLMLWRSADEGKTWSKGAVVNDVDRSAREGLHSMTADAAGHAAAVWLDLRSKGTRLYGAFSNDGGATWSKNVAVYESPDGTICQCCHPTLAAMGNGEFDVMFRNALGGNRDMYLGRVRNGEVVAKPEKLGVESWKLDACPMDGGGVAVADGRVVTAWRRGHEIFLAEPGQHEKQIGSGMDASVAAAGGKTYAVWNHGGAIESWSSGKTEQLSAAGAFPVVVALPGGDALASWEENGSIKTARLAK